MRGDHCGGQILLGGYFGARALRVSATYGFQPPATLEHLVVPVVAVKKRSGT